jgi:seryl-tRNA synthetase
MPSEELGSPAYRKYDIEAWMPANQFYGEVIAINIILNTLTFWFRQNNLKISPKLFDLHKISLLRLKFMNLKSIENH